MTFSCKPFRLSRRACLRGLGVSLALPWLEVMEATAQTAADPLRFLTLFVPNGMRMDRYKPSGTGTDWTPSPILSSLSPYKEYVNVVSGLANYPASVTTERWSGSHARGTGALLTQTPLAFTSGDDISNDISLDQVIAQSLQGKTHLPSLELGIRQGSSSGNCEDGYSCAYLHNLSWADPTTPMKKMIDPRLVFERLFQGYDPNPNPDTGTPVVNKQPLYDRSLLDTVQTRIQSLNQRLGQADRAKLDEYLTAVRAVEKNLPPYDPSGTSGPTVSCDPGSAPPSELEYPDHVKVMLDLIVLAFQCDQTRVISFMLEDALNTPARYGFLGVDGGYHGISHHGGDPSKLNAIEKICTWEVEQLAYLLGRLLEIKEGDKTLLDNSIILFTSEFGDGDDHYHWDLPVLTAGKAGGRFKTGLHVSYPVKSGGQPEPSLEDQPMANLFLNILEAFDIERTTFGSTGSEPYGTQPLAELKA